MCTQHTEYIPSWFSLFSTGYQNHTSSVTCFVTNPIKKIINIILQQLIRTNPLNLKLLVKRLRYTMDSLKVQGWASKGVLWVLAGR